MIDTNKREEIRRQKDKVRRRIRVEVDPDNYQYIPAKKQVDFYDEETLHNVAVYVRVSTDDIRQTTSYELQKKYYEDFVLRHPNWTLVRIYADEGISGTSMSHRDQFNRMIADCKAGKIDLIITKSVSRFARNVRDFIGVVRDLADLEPKVGVFFESECIFSLNDDSQMALTFQATMAEEESHTRSRSMEASLRMRLDNGLPLTPKLYGYTHDTDGNLVLNEEEAPTVKLIFYMYLYGYSSKQIADTLIQLERRQYYGKIDWTPSGVTSILRNERHCGAVLTRKTYTKDYRTHKKRKNRGERPQSWYYNHHDPIVTPDDFIAVQHLLENAKYKNKGVLPELRVIDSGLLKGFVVINPRWAGFKAKDYYHAGSSAYSDDDNESSSDGESFFTVEAGDFDLREFEVVRCELFDTAKQPALTISVDKLVFSRDCVQKIGEKGIAELLINPVSKKLAIRPTQESNRSKIVVSKKSYKSIHPRAVSCAAFGETLFELLGWNCSYKYKIIGSVFESGTEFVYVFDTIDTEALIKPYMLENAECETAAVPFMSSGSYVRAVPEGWIDGFGDQYYLAEQSYAALHRQTEEEWKLRIEGRLFDNTLKLKVTDFETLRAYIEQETAGINMEDGLDDE